ncbi:hypothetical protein EMMF5_003989 [Cystobasidiomycetes sp. EMM_F5]
MNTPSSPSPRLKVHLAGRVYRPLPHPRTAAGGWLGQPDERVGDDAAVIRCVCEQNMDIGTLMVQCDECAVWLHAECVGLAGGSVTDEEEYMCPRCVSKGGRLKRRRGWERECITPPPSASRTDDADLGHDKSDSDDGLEVEQPSPLTDIHSSPSYRQSHPSLLPSPSASPSARASRAFLSHPSAQSTASPLIKATANHPLLTPSKARKSQERSLPSTTSSNQSIDALHIPLPQHYTHLLNLHVAVERALLLHLATEGSKASAAMALASAENNEQGIQGNSILHVDLPDLVTYSSIRSSVERGCGKRFGPTELAQLVWLWEGGLNGPYATEGDEQQTSSTSLSSRSKSKEKRRGGLSFSVTSTQELDKMKMRRVRTWGIGIQLQIKHNTPQPEFEVVYNPNSPSSSTPSAERRHKKHNATTPPTRRAVPTSPQSPQSSPSSCSSINRFKRSGLSVMPLWSSNADFRRQELRRRLGECVVKAHDASLPLRD